MTRPPRGKTGSRRRDLLLGGGLMALASAASGQAQAQRGRSPGARVRRPNIIVMLVDNMGWGDLSCYVGPIRGQNTPRLDRLASEGTRLTNFNVEPECTPSRSAFMTGRMPIRSGTSRVIISEGRDGISTWEYTLGQLLSDEGYATACFGKWHLGSAEERLPNNRGFDEWYGIPRSSGETAWALQPDFDPEVYQEQPVLEGRRGERNRTVRPYDYAFRPLIDREVTERSVSFIRRQARADKPFFLFAPFTLPHVPPLAHPDFVKPGKTQYQNVLAEIDHNAGRIIDAVTEAGVEEDTIIVFASENGPQTFQSVGIDYGAQSDTGPFRNEFASAWEGAIRTPCIIRWPGRVPAGRVSNEIFSLLDFYRTFATLAGAPGRVPADRAIDSIDQTRFLLGLEERSAREHCMFFYRDELHAIKWRSYKVHFKVREPATGTVRAPGQNVSVGVITEPNYPWVFHLDSDPKELWHVGFTSGWFRGRSVDRIQREYEDSIRRFPNLRPGADGPPA